MALGIIADPRYARLSRRPSGSLPTLPARGVLLLEEAERGWPMPATNREVTADGPMTAAISNSMVKLLHHYTGRGPTRARTTIGPSLQFQGSQDCSILTTAFAC